MKLTTIKKLLVCILALTCIITVAVVPVIAAEENISFSFTVKSYQKNSYASGSRLRETGRTDNPWKVNLAYTAEGAGSMNYFFLAGTNLTRTQYSNAYGVVQGTGAHYYRAYDNAQDKNVTLGARNNNNNSSSFTISGYWDEEIGRIMNNLPA